MQKNKFSEFQYYNLFIRSGKEYKIRNETTYSMLGYLLFAESGAFLISKKFDGFLKIIVYDLIAL